MHSRCPDNIITVEIIFIISFHQIDCRVNSIFSKCCYVNRYTDWRCYVNLNFFIKKPRKQLLHNPIVNSLN